MAIRDQLIADIAPKVAINLAAVAAARTYILKNFSEDVGVLINGFLEENGKSLTQTELLNDSNKQAFEHLVADWLSWNNSVRRAIHELHAEAYLYVTNDSEYIQDKSCYFIEGSSHTTTKFSLSFWSILTKLHSKYHLNPIYKDSDYLQQNSDICLNNLQLSSAIGDSVSRDLEQAVECYKKHLYLPAVVMIGRAAEGAWTSMATAFIPIMTESTNRNQLDKMLNSFFSLANLMEKVEEAYAHKRFDKPLVRTSGIRLADMKQSYIWSDHIRGYRNSVHPAAAPPVQLNQENTTSILLAVNTHFPRFDKIIQTAEQLANE